MNKDELFDFNDLFKQSGGKNHEDSCPILPMLAATMMMPKPFGMTWDDEVINKFLVQRGYIFITVTDDSDNEFEVVVKKEDPIIPKEPNVIVVFERELQKLFIDFLLKNS